MIHQIEKGQEIFHQSLQIIYSFLQPMVSLEKDRFFG